jgi:aldose 1-epimerase
VGASVLIFDYRGYGRSQGTPSEPGIMADARAARTWLAARAGLSENQIVLLGESIGCAVAVDLAADGARALVLQNAFSTLPDVAAHHYPCLPVRWLMRTRLDCLGKIGGYHGPLLQSHAERDSIVPIQLGRRLFEAAHEPKQFLVIAHRDHNDSLPPDYYHELAAFLAAPAAATAAEQETSPIRPEGPVETAHKSDQSPLPPAGIRQDRFGATADGLAVNRFTLRNRQGMLLRLISYGATVTELWVPDRNGKLDDVVLGFDNLRQYETQSPYFGCTAGRVAFRITDGKFTLDGKPFQLMINRPPHHLHGGIKGLSKVVWHGEPLASPAGPAVRFTHTSPDGDQGYPGTLRLAVLFTLTEQNELRIEYTATTDQPTPVNLTHHSYFNLAGAGSGTVLGHVLQLQAGRYTPLDDKLVPIGRIASVAGTPWDFRLPTAIGERMKPGSPVADGYDMAYVADRTGSDLARVALLDEPRSGRRLEVLSTEPAVIVYTGNYLDGTFRGKQGAIVSKHGGVCLETAHLPDSVNHPDFPSIILRPGQTYWQTCVYRFSARAPM